MRSSIEDTCVSAGWANDRPAVVLPAVRQLAVPAQLLEAVVVTLAVAREINGPGHHLDVHQVVDYPEIDH